MRCLLVGIVIVCSAVAAVSASAGCGDGEGLSYLVVTPRVKAALLDTYRSAHPELASRTIVGPLPGRTFYGADGLEWAVATFSVSGRETQPIIFQADMGAWWKLKRETQGAICTTFVPRDLIVSIWKMRKWSGNCYIAR